MSVLEILSIAAAVITVSGFCIATARWIQRRKRSPEIVQPHTGLPYWDVAIVYSEGTSEETTVARLSVVGETREEAGHRAKQLVQQWNQVSLGFEILSGKTIPDDDEGKPISIIRPDLLPQSDGDSVPITAFMVKREPPSFPGLSSLRRLFLRASRETD